MEFSIIVPTYNSARFLKACIDSVKAQRFSDWELVIVNDGSTDDSDAILSRSAAEDDRIHIISQDNRGQFFARQRGIEAAVGEYLVFLDSDDELEPECLSALDKILSARKWDIVMYTGRIIADGHDTGRTIGEAFPESCEVSVRWLRQSLISSNAINSLCIKAIRRTLFCGDRTDYSGFAGTHCGEDKVRLLYPVTHAERIFYITDRLYRYNRRPDSVMHRFCIDAVPRMMAGEMFSMLRVYMEKWGMTERKYKSQLEAYEIRTFLSVYYGMRRECRTREEKKAFRSYPWNMHPGTLTPGSFFCSRISIKEKFMLLAAALRL